MSDPPADHRHAHKFDPANLARLDSPGRRERMPAAAFLAAVDPPPGLRLADIGVGTGYCTLPVLDAVAGRGTFYAIDIAPVVLEELRRRLAAHPHGVHVHVILAEEARIPLPDQCVDHVVMGAVLHELEDRAASLAEACRLLVPDGRLVVADWDRRPGQQGEADYGPPYEHRVPREEAEAALAAAGFRQIRTHVGFTDAYLLSALR